LAGLGSASIEFNYMGRFGFPEATDWSYAAEQPAADLGPEPDMRVSHALTINAMTQDHADGPVLAAYWSFPTAVLSEESVRALAETWFTALDALCIRARTIQGDS
jgi:non-ribosomal peptide synthase protein (TIGR01720 family)